VKERVKRVECAECFGPGSSLAFDAVQKQLADGGVELSFDQLRKGSAEKPEETLHRALDLGPACWLGMGRRLPVVFGWLLTRSEAPWGVCALPARMTAT
jgi:hypothetical protein